MPDFRVDDQEHAKDTSRRAGLAGMGLHEVAGSWCMAPSNLTDGWVPAWFVQSWPGGRKAAAALVSAELWRPATRDGQPGWQFVDWSGQRTAAEIQAERDAARDRMRAVRNRKRSPDVRPNVRANTSGTFGRSSDDVRDALTLTLTPGGQVGGYNPPTTRAREKDPPKNTLDPKNGLDQGKHPDQPPAERCPAHLEAPTSDPCRACGDARKARQRWDATAARMAAGARSTEARQRAEIRAAAIAQCDLCDDRGYHGGAICAHDPDQAARAARGRAQVLAALQKGQTA